jgi:hypothetical protein
MFRTLPLRCRRNPFMGELVRECFDGDLLKRLVKAGGTGESSSLSLLCDRLRRAKSPYAPPLVSLLVGVIAFGAISEQWGWNGTVETPTKAQFLL